MAVKTWRDRSDAELGTELLAIKRQREDLIKRANAVMTRAKTEKRDLTEDETRETDSLLDEADVLERRLDNSKMERQTRSTDPGDGGRSPARQPGEYRALGKDESLVEHLRETGEIERRSGRSLHLGRAIVGIATGRWEGAEDERRAMSGSSDTAGGYLLNAELSSTWIDLARAASVMVKAGVTIAPMRSSEMSMAQVTGDPTPAWRLEGAAVATSEPTLGKVRLTAKSLGVIVPVSKELLADAANASDLVQSVLVSAMALEFDRAVLDGDGVIKPRGIRQTPSVGTLSVAGAATTLKFAEAIGSVRQQNEEPTGIILHPRTFSAAIDRATDSTNQPLRLPPSLERMPFFQTTSVPTNLGGGSDTVALVGDFSKVVVGLRQQIEIAIVTQATDATGRGFPRNEALIVAMLRADSMLVREKSFCVMTGITN